MSKFLSFLQSSLHYEVYGSGKRLMLAFHGYGKTGSSLAVLEAAFGQEYTIIAPDIFFHGQSIWRENGPLTPEQYRMLVQELAAAEGLPTHDITWFGYSIGARMALLGASEIPGTSGLILVAADGLNSSALFRFVTNTGLGRWLFRWFVRNGNLVLALLRGLVKTRLFPDSLYQFVARKTDTREKRQLVYDIWTHLRHMLPRRQKLLEVLNQPLPVLLIAGKRDTVTVPGDMKKLDKALKLSRFIELEEGHHLIKPELNPVLVANWPIAGKSSSPSN